MTTFVGILLIIVCFLLIFIVLLQKGRGGGLSGAFGGAGGHSAFGSKTGDVFTWITSGLVLLFILLAVIANWVFVPEKFQGAPEPAEVSTPAEPAETTTQPQETPAQK
ncbi:MAG: preprotein translocase subunit SecG [Phycisphaerae bacterium]|jgi:preprotein translocase subunit SecG|nr:preprotein translocase subunit SecG [Phycisphaerae bacterium]